MEDYLAGRDPCGLNDEAWRGWLTVLAIAENHGQGVTMLLYVLRKEGAELVKDNKGVRIQRGTIPEAIWQKARRDLLMEHKEAIIKILREV